MYDISQLNDLLVPELHDIADQLNIPNNKKLNKQDLVTIILEKQDSMTKDNKSAEGEKPKRKRIPKTDAVADTPPQPPVAPELPKKEPMPVKPKKAETENCISCCRFKRKLILCLQCHRSTLHCFS
jgi:transcription termination factor Rho